MDKEGGYYTVCVLYIGYSKRRKLEFGQVIQVNQLWLRHTLD